MKVAKGISNNVYNGLDLSVPASYDWSIAIDIFSQRFYGRYIEPVDKLIEIESSLPNSDKKFGFTVTAINCLLIETMACFYTGLPETPKNQNERCFVEYLTNPDSVFAKHFNRDTATLFYREIRCGILHQSETKNSSLIKAHGPLIKINEKSVVVNRNALHSALKEEFHNYVKRLSEPSNDKLRENFKKKMDHICRKKI